MKKSALPHLGIPVRGKMQFMVVSANRCDCERGVRFAGGSSVIAPDSSIISYRDSGDGIVYAQVDLDLTKQKISIRHR